MKNLERIKVMEIEALSDFQEHISLVLSDMDIYREYLDRKEFKNFQRCYDYLDILWEKIEETILKLCDADERSKNT